METNLRNQRDSFTTYITKVDKIYIEKVKPFNDLFNNEDCKKSELFMKGLFLVIKSFLEGNAEELFIKIPVFSGKGSLCISLLCDVILQIRKLIPKRLGTGLCVPNGFCANYLVYFLKCRLGDMAVPARIFNQIVLVVFLCRKIARKRFYFHCEFMVLFLFLLCKSFYNPS